MSTIDYRHLKLLAVFNAVAEAGSFAAAARNLGSSRSRVSEQLTQLEETLAVRLLQRSTRQLKLTREGERILQQARKLPAVLANVEALLSDERPAGKVKLTANHDIAHQFILPQLARMKAEFPEIELTLILDDRKLDLIDSGIDLAVRIGYAADNSMIARVMHRERAQLFASAEFIARHGAIKTLKALEQLPWITLLAQSGAGEKLYRGETQVAFETRESFSCNSPLMLQKMVLEGLGVGLLLPSTVRPQIERAELVPVLPSLAAKPVVFSLVYPSRRQVPARTRAVIDFLLRSQMFNAGG
ncbi:MAG: LysR substrate-binding domain-containing protein [Pseudomonadales bacterium]